MKPPKFQVGQAVVCIDESFASTGLPPAHKKPRKGMVYHVRHIRPAIGRQGQWGILLEEIRNTKHGCGTEDGFLERRFAPVELLPDAELAELLAEALYS